MYKVRLLINVALAVCAMIPGGLSARNQFSPNAKGVDGEDCSVQLLAQNGHESGGWIATPDVSCGGDVWEPSIKMSSGVVPSGKHGHIRATPSIPIYGNVMFSAAWPSSEPRKGIYAFGKSSEFACNEVFLDSKMDGSNGALYFDGKFLLTIHAKIMIANIVTHTIYDAETWEVLKITTHASVGSTAYSMAYDKSDGTIYGCFKDDNGTGFVFGTLDPNTGKRVKIMTWQFGLTALAFTHDGRLVGINPSGWLFEVDKNTGAMTEIGNTGLPSKYATSGAIDPRHGTYYYAVCNDDADGGAALYTVNPDDASVSKVYDIPDRMQIQGMYIPEDPAADGAPAAVGDLYAEFEDNALVGSVGFKCPTETYDGTAGTGSLSYRVMANDEEVASGSAGWDENVVADVALDSPGNYTFVVTVSNADGESPRTRLKRYVGDDAPNPVTNVVLERSDGYFSLSWGASVGSANGAWFDQSEVTYTVTRQPDNAVVASRIVETSFSEPVPADGEMKLYYYTVTPEFGLASGKSVASNKIPVGYVTAPYVEAFDNADAMLPYTIIDVDNDNKTWAWYSGGSKSPRATQSTTMPKDDWLITPPIKMEGGTAYKLTFSTWGNTKTTVENMEVKLGTSPTVEAMDVTILEPFEIMAASSDKMKVEEYVVAPAPGIYYIGFHAISPAKKSYLYIDDIELSSNIPAASPDAVTSLELIPDNYGRLSANISFNAPVTTVGGDPVGEIVKIELWRDNDLVKVFESPGAGDRLDYDDTVDRSRYYTYSVIPFNAVGAGRVSEIRGFIGVNPPASVADVRLLELPDECMVELSWKAPEYDIDGNPINSVPVVYDILRSDRSVVATDIHDVSYRFQAVEKGASQRFVQYFVWAKTSAGGSSEAIGSNVIPVGVPYEMPFGESVSDCRPASIWGVEPLSVTGNGEWSFASDATAPYSQDSDNGYFLYSSKRTGDSARLSSGKIALTSDNPVVSFYYYAMPDYKNTLDLQVRVSGGEYTTLKTVTIGETGRREWIRVTVPLDEYRGKVIQLGLLGTTRSHTQIHVDNITVTQQWKVDMAATTIKVPASFRSGESKQVTVSVENLGEETVPVASVTLYRNGTVVGTGTVENIAAGDARTVMFTDQLAVSRDTRIEYYASVDCAGDMCRDNDRSSVVVSKLIIPDYPVVDDLGGSADGAAVRLSWCTPTLNGNPGPVTDTAEDYESFSIGLPDSEVDNDNVGGWTMVDVDGGPGTYGINNSQGGSYKYPNAGRPMAFMVFSYDDAAVGSVNWKGRDGSDKCFVAFADTDKQNDDWMISPLLTGDAQRVSFWARSLTVQYGNETFEFLVSSSGKDVADFVRLGTSRSVGAVWTEFNFDIPDGTRYFAIRCVSADKFALMIDDISYEADAPYSYLEPVGYNVYRDGMRINDSVLSDAEYFDNDAASGLMHTYNVTVVYRQGESGFSNDFGIETSGIESVSSDNRLRIVPSAGAVEVSGASGYMVNVCAVDGKVIVSLVGAETMLIPLDPGSYVVSVGDRSAKILIR